MRNRQIFIMSSTSLAMATENLFRIINGRILLRLRILLHWKFTKALDVKRTSSGRNFKNFHLVFQFFRSDVNLYIMLVTLYTHKQKKTLKVFSCQQSSLKNFNSGNFSIKKKGKKLFPSFYFYHTI
jgi:hypothetical protein